jgi:ATP-binding cassette subfamily C (CFTR/MRP) protein 1
VERGTFSWGVDEPPVLHDISVKIPRGKLTAIVGTVGCGKSSLISAFLGEMDRLSGTAVIEVSMMLYPDSIKNNSQP